MVQPKNLYGTLVRRASAVTDSNLRLLLSLGAVNAVPDNCSAYSPYGHFCGLFCNQMCLD